MMTSDALTSSYVNLVTVGAQLAEGTTLANLPSGAGSVDLTPSLLEECRCTLELRSMNHGSRDKAFARIDALYRHVDDSSPVAETASVYEALALDVYHLEHAIGMRATEYFDGMREGLSVFLNGLGDHDLSSRWDALAQSWDTTPVALRPIRHERLFRDLVRDGLVHSVIRHRGDSALPDQETLAVDCGLMALLQMAGFDLNTLSAATIDDVTCQMASFPSIPARYLSLAFRKPSRHECIGTQTNLDAHWKAIRNNLQGYRTYLPAWAATLFYRLGRLTCPLVTREGKLTNFHLVFERGYHEARNGIRLALFEGSPSAQKEGYMAKVECHFGEHRSLQIINIQGASSLAVEGQAIGLMTGYHKPDEVKENPFVMQDFARLIVEGDHESPSVLIKECLANQKQRFADVFEGLTALDLLVASMIRLAASWEMNHIEGLRDRAQVARNDAVAQGRATPKFYDFFFKRFGFDSPSKEEDWWRLHLGGLESLRSYFEGVRSRSPIFVPDFSAMRWISGPAHLDEPLPSQEVDLEHPF